MPAYCVENGDQTNGWRIVGSQTLFLSQSHGPNRFYKPIRPRVGPSGYGCGQWCAKRSVLRTPSLRFGILLQTVERRGLALTLRLRLPLQPVMLSKAGQAMPIAKTVTPCFRGSSTLPLLQQLSPNPRPVLTLKRMHGKTTTSLSPSPEAQ